MRKGRASARHKVKEPRVKTSPMKPVRSTPLKIVVWSAFTMMFSIPAAAVDSLKPSLTCSPDRVELTAGQQRVVFSRENGGSSFVVTTQVRQGDGWAPFFDAGLPLLRGAAFDLSPAEYDILTDEPDRKEVILRGQRTSPSYDYDIRAEARSDSPLIKLTITCRLPEDITLSGREPVAALWMKKPKVDLAVDQGPDSIYGSLGVPHGLGFPAAYLWDEGKEAAVFFDMTPMTWFSPQGVYRFNDIRIMTRSIEGKVGLGMHLKKASGDRIPAGDMVTVMYLYGAPRDGKPTKLEGIGRMLEVFASLHPGTSEFPKNYLEGGDVTWEYFTRRGIEDLMVPGVTCREIESTWNDPPLGLVEPTHTLLVHSGRCEKPGTDFGWDFSTVNNHLTPWILYTRLNPDERMRAFAMSKRDGLPRFYDPRAGIIRYGTREPAHLGGVDMSWQNFFFHFEALRAYDALAPEDFNPAVAGRLLMAADGLIELAHNVDYAFPQWWNPYTKQPEGQKDVPRLGKVREPWQVGTYAYVMTRAHEMTGERKYLDEARKSIQTLLTSMKFTVSNDVYTREYSDPAEFPVAELFGNSYGVVASRKVAEATGDPAFLGYARDFLHTLLRLTFWYEDETDPVSRDLRNAGLFYPHCGAHVATSWETVEAYVGIVDALANDTDNPLQLLLLKLCNLNRINSFYFYPAAYSPTVQALDPKRNKEMGQYFPIEPFYCLEGMGGHRGDGAGYMAGLGMWNYWLYEALAEADDRTVTVLNTTVLERFQEAVSGAERNFIVFNPSENARDFRLRVKHLSPGDYRISARDSADREKNHEVTHSQLEAGLPLSLGPQEHLRIRIGSVNAQAEIEAIEVSREARDKLSHAYACLQRAATVRGVEPLVPLKEDFQRAMKDYRGKDYGAAARRAQAILDQVEGMEGER